MEVEEEIKKEKDINHQFLEWIRNEDNEALDRFYMTNDWHQKLNFEWVYQKIQQINNGHSLSLIGLMYKKGYYLKQNYEKAFEYYQKSADLGNSYALNNLGKMYQYGLYIKQDYEKAFEKAFEYYQKSANLGNSHGLNNLGYMYYVKQNYEKAFEYFQISANLGNLTALNRIVNMYHNGEYRNEKVLEYMYNAMLETKTETMNFKEEAKNFFRDNPDYLIDKIINKEKENKKLEEKVKIFEEIVEQQQMEIDCIPDYGKDYFVCKKDFESRCVELKSASEKID